MFMFTKYVYAEVKYLKTFGNDVIEREVSAVINREVRKFSHLYRELRILCKVH